MFPRLSSLIPVLLGGACLGQAPPAAPNLEVAGELVYKIYPPPNAPKLALMPRGSPAIGLGPLQTEHHFKFTATISGCRALLCSESEVKGKTYEAGIDSGTIYSFVSFITSTGRVEAAEIYYGEMPRDSVSGLNYLWLAYGSACYLNTQTSNYLHPIWRLDDPTLRLRGFKLPAHWRTMEVGGLPERVVYLNDGYRRWREGTQSVKDRLPPPFGDGYTNAVYSVSASTNIAGIEVPTEWSFVRYGVGDPGGGGLQYKVVTRTDGWASIARISSETHSLKPNFSGSLKIVDYRFSSSNPPASSVTYYVTNGIWGGQKEAGDLPSQAMRKYQRRIAAEKVLDQKTKEQQAVVPYRRFVVFAVAFIVSAGALLMVLKMRGR